MNKNNWVTDASFQCSCEYADFIACHLIETECSSFRIEFAALIIFAVFQKIKSLNDFLIKSHLLSHFKISV